MSVCLSVRLFFCLSVHQLVHGFHHKKVKGHNTHNTYLFILLRKLMRSADLVDDLCHSDHLALVCAYRHTEDAVGPVARLLVYLRVETWILGKDGWRK